MTLKSIVLASMLTLLGAMAINTAYADAAASVSATCKDGTTFTGKSKSGACSGHKGVKEWATNAAPAAKADAPVATAAPATSKATAAPSKTSAMPTVAAEGGGAGKVWVNDKSNVYHCFGTKFYGKTKSGSYMTEAEAKAKGGHADMVKLVVN